MSASEIIREQEKLPGEAVRLLYICDFPPSNLGGGPILMSRLLREVASDRVMVLTSTRFARVSPPHGRLQCKEITVGLSEEYGRFGLGRIRTLLNWARIPLIAMAATKIIWQQHMTAVLTVLHGRFHFAAMLAARITGIPYIVVVHDDYTPAMNMLERRLTRTVLRHAAHIYSISPEMQETLRVQFNVESELQRPATEALRLNPVRRERSGPLSIVYAGQLTAAVEDSVRMLADLIISGKLRDYGVPDTRLHLYTVVREERKRSWGWDHPDIVIHPWVAQPHLPKVLHNADILFLPFSFSAAARYMVETAFPSKTADYLASGAPILVCGPCYSSLVAYASGEGFAEMVTDGNADSLARAIQRIALSPSHAQTLSSRALQVFFRYHDIRQQRIQFMRVLDTITRANFRYRKRR